MGREDKAPTEQDLKVIAWQIGRLPQGVLGVVRSCSYGFPQVIQTHPLHRHGSSFVFFPTLFWLTCPFLSAAVSQMETRGDVKRWEARLEEDPQLAALYRQAQESYRQERNGLLTPEDWAFLFSHGALNRTQTGIVGLANFGRVKCLHGQLAQFLARGNNPIGQAVAQELKQLECPPERVLCRQAL